jgi:flagellar biosynthesis protein FlhF
MVEESFSAPTPQEAFALAREKYGRFSDLKLLRAVQKRDENGRLYATIVVSVPQEAYLESIGIDEEAELVEELTMLRDQMEQMKTALQQDGSAIESVKTLMRKRGLRSAWLDRVLEPIEHDEMAQDKGLLSAYILEEIDEQLRIASPRTDGQRVMMFIGPTGVGKTTTIAKLTARLKLDPQSPKKVAIVNLDTFRVGAFEQLEHYAATLGVIQRKVDSIDALGRTLETLEDYDTVLIDTAGISPYDIERLVQTVSFLKALPSEAIEVALVISATAKYEDIVAVYEHFSFVNIDSVILTKIDETHAIGDALGFLLEKHLPVSYISTGQTVPDDLVPADKERILERFVEALHV